HNNDHHETATNWVLCGRFGSAFGDYPAMGAVVAHETGFNGKLPPYVAVPRNPSFTWELGKSVFLGGRCESFKAGDPNAKDYRVQDLTPGETLSEKRTRRRENLLQAVDQLARKVEDNDQIATFDAFHQRAAQMVLSSEARSALVEDMHQRGLMKETLLVCFGEFGRTPKMNKDAGRDHWGPAASLLFAGAGVKPGQVIGATDKQGAYVTRRPVRPADVAWTIY